MKILKKVKAQLKRLLGVIRVDKKLERLVEGYTDNLYEFYKKEDYLSSPERLPYYFYWDGRARLFFSLSLLFLMLTACLLISLMLNPSIAGNISGYIVVIVFFLVYSILMLVYYIPDSYWSKKKHFKNVRVIRLNTRKAIERFARNYERAEELARPYKEAKAAEEAKRKAAEEEKQRLIAETEAREAEELRAKFRPQYMALLQYVETNYMVSTPDPDCHAGCFTIILPNAENCTCTEESFSYTLRERSVDLLIAKIANIDYVMRKRAELRKYIEATTNPRLTADSHVPSDDIHA